MSTSEISPSLANAAPSVLACPICGAAVRLRGGECLRCLLLAGMAEVANVDASEFAAVLRELDVAEPK